MAWRKWLVRGLVLAIISCLGGGVLVYRQWTNPVAVRRQVMEKLGKQFSGAHVSLESAHMQLLGGIAVTELRLTRRDDPDGSEVFYAPRAVIQPDKEQLLDGKLVIRKVEVYRPRLRVVRGTDGRWNVHGLLASPDLREFVPMVVLHQATLIIEDRLAPPGTPPFEVRDLKLQLVNDPIQTLVIDAGGTSDTAGAVKLSATFGRKTDELTVNLDLPSLPIGPALYQRLAPLCPDKAVHLRQLEGTGQLTARLDYRPTAKVPLHYELKVGLSQGKFNHPRLPQPLEQIEASAQIVDGRVPVGSLKAASGTTTLEAKVSDLRPEALDNDGPDLLKRLVAELDFKAEHVPLTRGLFDLLPEPYRKLDRDFSPRGLTGVEIHFRREASGQAHHRCLIRPERAQALANEFKYPVDNVTGTVECTSTPGQPDTVKLDLVGRAASRPVFLRGEVRGEAPGHEVAIDLWATDFPLDKTLHDAIPAQFQQVADAFHPTGMGDFKVSLRKAATSPQFNNRFIFSFHHASVCYDPFPYRLDNVSGVLDIQADHWEFHDFRGTRGGCEFRTSGRSFRAAAGECIEVEIHGRNFVLDRELKKAVKEPELQQAWTAFAPSGLIDFDGTVYIPPGNGPQVKPEVVLTVAARGCTIMPEFFAYELTDLSATIHYANRKVDVSDVRTRHGASVLSLDKGEIYLKPGGGMQARLNEIEGKPLRPDPDFVRALPPALRKGFASVEINDAVALKARLIIETWSDRPAQPLVYWNGQVALRDATLRTGLLLEHVTGTVGCSGLYNPRDQQPDTNLLTGNFDKINAVVLGQPFQSLQGHFWVTNKDKEVFCVNGLLANYCGGQVYGSARFEFGPTLLFEVDLTGSAIDLTEFGRVNLKTGADVAGRVKARLHVNGQGVAMDGLRGFGTIELPSGKIGNLPVLIDLLKFLSLRLPDRTFFEEAYAAFAIDGRRIDVTRLDLLGNVVSLRGKGGLNLDGSDLSLNFSVDWARMGQLLPEGIKNIQEAVSDRLLRVTARGSLGKGGKIEFAKEPVPGLVDPVKRLLNGQPKQGGLMNKPAEK